MALFSSFYQETPADKLDKLQQGSLFHSIEYELAGIVNKITNINNLDEKEIKSIIMRQHQMILNYDLFLMDHTTRSQAQTLFTSKKFLKCFLDVIRLLDITQHEKICINKLAYDYYILPDKDHEIDDLLYMLSTEVNGREVVVLSGILGMTRAQILAMIRNSSFKEEKCVHRVNTYLVKCCKDITLQNIVNIYCFLFERFTPLFVYSMLEYPSLELLPDEKVIFDNITIALATILESIPMNDIKKVLSDYKYILDMTKSVVVPRCKLRTLNRDKYKRILTAIAELQISDDIVIE